MRRTPRRLWGGLLVVGLLIIPAYGLSDILVGWPASPPVPFLATVKVQNHALQALASVAAAPAVLLLVAGDPKLTALQAAPRPTVRGSAASLVTTAVTAASQKAFVIVQDGQTLWEFAETYDMTVDAIVEANGLSSGDLIRPGQRLVIPGGAADIPRRVTLSRSLSSAVSIARGFIWPARGRITSGFGLRRHPIFGTREMHTGIDIGAPSGTPVFAARAGRVTYAGSESGYGKLIVIDHGDGVTTRYSHLSIIDVRIGQVVLHGEMVGRVGNTGYSTGPHLLFEIRVNGKPLDPLKYL